MWSRLSRLVVWLHQLDGWQRASLIGALLGPAYFLTFRLPAFVRGDRPFTRSEIDGDIAAMVGFYLLALMIWASSLERSPPLAWRRWRSAAYTPRAVETTARILPSSVAFVGSLPRRAWLAIRIPAAHRHPAALKRRATTTLVDPRVHGAARTTPSSRPVERRSSRFTDPRGDPHAPETHYPYHSRETRYGEALATGDIITPADEDYMRPEVFTTNDVKDIWRPDESVLFLASLSLIALVTSSTMDPDWWPEISLGAAVAVVAAYRLLRALWWPRDTPDPDPPTRSRSPHP
jgi:hypothetical protein